MGSRKRVRAYRKWRRVYRKNIAPISKKAINSLGLAYDYVSWPVKKRLRKFKNTIRWLPIIWEDQQWDEHYLFRILEHKLKIMENHFRHKGICVSAKGNANKMKVCRLLCQRLIDGNYTNPYVERNRSHFDWFEKKMLESFDREPNEDGFILVIDHNEPDEPDDRWILPAHKHEEMLIDQDVELLCSMIKKYVRGWWD